MSSCRWILGSLLLFCATLSNAQTPKAKKEAAVDLKPYQKFAERIAQWIAEKEAKKVADAIDAESLFGRALKGTGIPDDFKKSMIEGAKKSIDTFPNQIIKGIEQGGSYQLLRVHEVNGEVRALFRLLSDAGLNYHVLLLQPGKDGAIGIVDIYVTVAGEYISQSMRRFLLQTLALDPKKLKEGVIPQGAVDSAVQLKAIGELLRTQKFSEVLKEWEKLPAPLKKDKAVFLMRFTAASALMESDPQGYAKVIEEYQEAFPNDPTSDLILLDTWMLKKKFKEYQDALGRLDKALGGDPYLDVLRAIGYKEEKQYEKAKTAAEKAQRTDPDLAPAYDVLILNSVESKNYADAVRWLAEVERRFKTPVDEALKDKEYAEFLKSPEYAKWNEGRKKK